MSSSPEETAGRVDLPLSISSRGGTKTGLERAAEIEPKTPDKPDNFHNAVAATHCPWLMAHGHTHGSLTIVTNA